MDGSNGKTPDQTDAADMLKSPSAAGPAETPAAIDLPVAPASGRGRAATPVQRALGLLARREHSRQELLRKLAARGVDADAAHDALDRLSADGWQDDARFAGSLLRSRAGRGYGPLRIRAELGTHGLDRDVIGAAFDAYEGDWQENARDLAWRRFGAGLAEDRALQRKAADFLIRRGFSGDEVRAALRAEDWP